MKKPAPYCYTRNNNMDDDRLMDKKNRPLILAIDGHDGTGKTTLATMLAQELGGAYLRPFAGAAGAALLEDAEKKDYRKVSAAGKAAIDLLLRDNLHDILVFDRHWMTIFTLIPPAYWEEWLPLPATTLCYADITTTQQRLGQRTEKTYDTAYHTHYLNAYMKIGKQFGVNVLRTDHYNLEECLAMLMQWAANL